MIDLAACAIVKDEAPHLPEWLAFHELVGVEHFLIYDNGSSDGTRELLAASERVTLIDWPGERAQLPAYAHALTHYREARWVAFLDADEYLFSPTYRPVPVMLREFEEHPAVGVCWAVYGEGGNVHPPDSTIGGYLCRGDDGHHKHTLTKSILQVSAVPAHQPADPHRFNVPTVDELHRPLAGPTIERPTWSRLRINHYYTRSAQEAAAKERRRRADNGALRGQILDPALSVIYDPVLLPYLPLLEAKLRLQSGA